MQIIKTNFKDLLIYKKNTYHDNRGFFRELFIEKHFKQKFIFDVMSLSKKNVLRGLHLQTRYPQAKLITVIRGRIFDVCVDCRPKSKTFGKHYYIELNETNNISLFIPEGFAHGFMSLTSNTIIHYKCTNYRDKQSETGILWNDKDLKIKWPIKNPIISKKDSQNQSFSNFIQSNK